jgi:hypothetical protein
MINDFVKNAKTFDQGSRLEGGRFSNRSRNRRRPNRAMWPLAV